MYFIFIGSLSRSIGNIKFMEMSDSQLPRFRSYTGANLHSFLELYFELGWNPESKVDDLLYAKIGVGGGNNVWFRMKYDYPELLSRDSKSTRLD